MQFYAASAMTGVGHSSVAEHRWNRTKDRMVVYRLFLGVVVGALIFQGGGGMGKEGLCTLRGMGPWNTPHGVDVAGERHECAEAILCV